MVMMNEPDALWVYGAGVLIVLVAYGRTWRRTPAAPPMPSSANKKLRESES